MSQQNYDVVIIGAGIGGMSAGALLANRGFRTLVLEKLDYIGGRWGTYQLEGFRVPAGALAIHYHGTVIEDVFREVGKKAEFTKVPSLYYRIGGVDYEMPAKGSLSVGMDIISKLEEDKVKITGGFAKAVGKEKVRGALRKGAGGARQDDNLTFKDWLLQYTENEQAHNIFDTITNTVCGSHSYEIPANNIFTWFVKMGGAREVAVAPRGNQENVEKLADVIRRNGGDVWLSSEVKKINTGGKGITSVTVVKGGVETEITGQVFLSNAGPRRTVQLVGQDHFSEDYLKEMRLKLRPHPVTMCYIASDWPLWPDDSAASILMLVGTRRITSVIPLSNISPAFAPEGQHLMFAFGGPPSNETIQLDKEEEQRQCLLDIEEQFPLFKDHGRMLLMVTKDRDDDLPEGRTRVGGGITSDTPFKNLYNVGDANMSYGFYGSNGAVEGAVGVVEKVRKQFQPMS